MAHPDPAAHLLSIWGLPADLVFAVFRSHLPAVEDEAPVRSFASRALKMRGYKVIEAESAEDAMVLLNNGLDDIDVLVSDVVMPGMDGPTFASKARQLRPNLKVIFISGYAEDSFRRNLSETDFLFLSKPFSLNDLTATVKVAMDGVQAAE